MPKLSHSEVDRILREAVYEYYEMKKRYAFTIHESMAVEKEWAEIQAALEEVNVAFDILEQLEKKTDVLSSYLVVAVLLTLVISINLAALFGIL